MACLGWALTCADETGGLSLCGTEFGAPVGPGAGRELMLIYVGRAILLGAALGWLDLILSIASRL